MATSSRIQVDVVLSPSSLANSLRGLADKIDPQPPMATAEDLRGAQAEIERLQAENTLLHNIADAACCLTGSPDDPGWRRLTDALAAWFEAHR